MKTIEQVLSIFPGTTKENWHQHTNRERWLGYIAGTNGKNGGKR